MCKQGETALVYANHAFRDVDRCIAPMVKALNEAGIHTIASCCGHGVRPGSIALVDGRELLIAPDYDTARIAERAFPPLNPGGEAPTSGEAASPTGRPSLCEALSGAAIRFSGLNDHQNAPALKSFSKVDKSTP